MDNIEELKFFKEKVACSINQIKSRGFGVSTGTFRLVVDPKTNTWIVQQGARILHPLSVFIEKKSLLKAPSSSSIFRIKSKSL